MKCSWGARAVFITLVLSVAYTRADAADASVTAARDLFEQFVFPEHAQPHDRLEALAHVARLIHRAEQARAVQPLYRRALRSSRVTGDKVARALAEGYAACLRKQRQPLVQVVRSLRRESEKASTPAARDGLVAVAERLHGIVTERSGTGAGGEMEAVAVPRQAARAKAPAIDLSGRTARAEAGKPLETPGDGDARPKLPTLAEGRPGAARAAVAPLARIEAFALGARPEELRVRPGHAAVKERGLSVRPPAPLPQPKSLSPGGRLPARPKAVPHLRTPEVAGRSAPPSLSGTPRVARPALSEIRVPGKGDTRPALAPPIEAPSEKVGRAREAAAEAGSAALQTLVKSLLDKADWKARKGKHQEALDLLGTVIRDARNSAASAQAVRRALPLSLAGLKGQDREAMVEEFEPWVARLGGELDRERAKVLVLQQRYRDGAFARARDGLKAFLAERPQSDLAPRASLLLGLATWRAGDRKASIRGLRELVERHPKDEVAPRALFLVGYLHFANGEREPATKAFLRVARDYPDSPFADRAVEFLGGEAAKRAEAEAEEEQ